MITVAVLKGFTEELRKITKVTTSVVNQVVRLFDSVNYWYSKQEGGANPELTAEYTKFKETCECIMHHAEVNKKKREKR